MLTKTETIFFSPAHRDDARRFEGRIDSRAVEFDLMDRVWADAAVVFTIERSPPDVIDPALRYRLVLEQLDGSVDMQLQVSR